MDAIDCIQTRRSVRSFLNKPLSRETIGELLDAGRVAPTAGNLQDAKFLFVTDRDEKMKIADACVEQAWIATAPVVIVVGSEIARDERMYGERGAKVYIYQNAAAAVQNILLCANALGLGACWVGAFDDDILRRAVNMPANVVPQAVIPVGHTAKHENKIPKLDLENVVYAEKWGNRMEDMKSWLGDTSHKVKKAFDKTRDILNIGTHGKK